MPDESVGVAREVGEPGVESDVAEAHAVAIEPMTAPADALNSGVGLRRLNPGETWTLEWGITLD